MSPILLPLLSRALIWYSGLSFHYRKVYTQVSAILLLGTPTLYLVSNSFVVESVSLFVTLTALKERLYYSL